MRGAWSQYGEQGGLQKIVAQKCVVIAEIKWP